MWHGFETGSGGPLEFLCLCLAHSSQLAIWIRHIVTEPLLLGYCVRLWDTKKREIVSLCSRGLKWCPPICFPTLSPLWFTPYSVRWVFTRCSGELCSGKLFAWCPFVLCNALPVFLSLERGSRLWFCSHHCWAGFDTDPEVNVGPWKESQTRWEMVCAQPDSTTDWNCDLPSVL